MIENGVSTVGVLGGLNGLHHFLQLMNLCPFRWIKLPLQSMFDSFVHGLDLSIGLGMMWYKKCFLIPNSSHRSLTFLLLNCLPLFETIRWKISNRHTIFFHMNLEVFTSVIFARGGFKLFGEVINSNKTCTTSALRYEAYEVHVPTLRRTKG